MLHEIYLEILIMLDPSHYCIILVALHAQPCLLPDCTNHSLILVYACQAAHDMYVYYCILVTYLHTPILLVVVNNVRPSTTCRNDH